MPALSGGGGSGTPTFQGVLLKRTTNFTTTNSNASIPDFDTRVYDTSAGQAAWSSVTNPSRITVPPEWDGTYVEVYARGLWASNTDNYTEIKVYKNGHASEDNLVAGDQGPPAPSFNTWRRAESDPIPVAAGDYFTATFRTPASETLLAYNGLASIVFGLKVVGAP
jgi:hypothetical protein